MRSIIRSVLVAITVVILSGSNVAQAVVAAPTTPDGFTQMFAAKNDQTWSGGDQMTSFKAPNGQIHWLSGDTILSNGVAANGSYPSTGTSMVSNRILLQKGGQLVNAMANGGIGVPDPATHTSTNQERYWAQGMFYANNQLYALCQRVIKDPVSGWFKFIGVELAKFSIAKTGKLTFISMKPTPATGVTGGVGPAFIQWAADGIVTNNYVYAYGYTNSSGNPYVPIFSYLARVGVASVESPQAWQYYKASTGQWVSSTSQLSTDLANQPDAVLATQISSVRIINGKVVIAHKPWNGYGSAVYAEVGANPEGPYVQTHLFDSPAGTWQGKNYMTYAPMLHPEQTLSGVDAGKTLVSIDWNGVDFVKDTLANADLYKPRFNAFLLP